MNGEKSVSLLVGDLKLKPGAVTKKPVEDQFSAKARYFSILKCHFRY
jgi:hypothetical protein